MDSIHLPNAIALPNAFGAPGTPLPPGQVVQALVLALIESDVFRLQLPQATVDVRSSVPLTPGSTITLAVKGGGPSAKLVIYSDTLPSVRQPGAAPVPRAPEVAPPTREQSATPPPRAQAGVPSLAGREPIGEAIVIARAPVTTTQAAAQPRISPEPAVVRDAPSIIPARVPPPQVQAPAVRVVTPEQAVTEAVHAAAPRQAGLAPLFADVEQVVQAAAPAVPPPVRAAAADVLSLRVALDETIRPAQIKQAFVRSGVLFEARLATAPKVAAPDAKILTPVPTNDLKAALLVFRQVLKVWSASELPLARGDVPPSPTTKIVPLAVTERPEAIVQPVATAASEAAIKQIANALAGALEEIVPNTPPLSPEQATSLARTVATALTAREPSSPEPPTNTTGAPPPPYRGAPLTAQAAAEPSIALDATPHETAERLIAQTDGALARQTLLQVASLPDQPDLPRTEAAQRWNFEIPFATPQGTAIAQFEVGREGRAPQSDPQTRTWRARFSLDVEPMGPVHASIALSGARTSVTLWAERHSTASRLQDNAALLTDALRAAELEPADFQLRVGAPPLVARQAMPGRFMDRAT